MSNVRFENFFLSIVFIIVVLERESLQLQLFGGFFAHNQNYETELFFAAFILLYY